MRTRFELVLAGPGDEPARQRAVAEEVFAEIDRVETVLSAFRRDSELFALNAHAGQGPVRVSADLLAFIAEAGVLTADTGGAFDPTVGAVTALLRGPDLPSRESLTRAREVVGFARIVERGDGTIALGSANARLDPGALGKGWALDRARVRLADLGIADALLHAGTSSVLAMGRDRDRESEGERAGWRVSIAGKGVATLVNTSLSVSAPTGRTLTWPDGRTGHIVDPRTGDPARAASLAAVVAPSGAVAEAWSTALLVLGVDAMDRFKSHVPSGSALVRTDGNDSLCGTALTP
jgi:thiamine biosynthesis lipoprotein